MGYIYVECKADKALIHHLSVSSKIIHSGNRGEICKVLEKTENSIGIMDEDPNSPQPHYFKKLKHIQSKEGLKLYKDKERDNKVILICPRLEEWVLEIVKEEKININDFDLPTDPNQFHKRVNVNISKFQQLVNTLKKENRKLQILINFIKD